MRNTQRQQGNFPVDISNLRSKRKVFATSNVPAVKAHSLDVRGSHVELHAMISYRKSDRGAAYVGAAAFVVVAITAVSSKAAPVTFIFDATIVGVSNEIPFDVGIEYEVGDIIEGRFTFLPQDGAGAMTFTAVQPYAFSLNVNEVVLETPNFTLRGGNDWLVADYPLADEVDALELGAAGLSAVGPAAMLNIDASRSGFSMGLRGSTSVMLAASHPADLAVWNAFNFERHLTIQFRDGQGGAMGLQATVGSFGLVPEPSTLAIVSLSGVVCLFKRHRSYF